MDMETEIKLKQPSQEKRTQQELLNMEILSHPLFLM